MPASRPQQVGGNFCHGSADEDNWERELNRAEAAMYEGVVNASTASGIEAHPGDH